MPAFPVLNERCATIALALLLLAALPGCGRENRESAGSGAPPAAAGEAAEARTATGDASTAQDAVADLGTLEAVALELGTTLDADGRVAVAREVVAAADAVHVSLVTVGEAGAAPIAVRWRDAAGTEIDADERAISATGPAVHTFTRQPEGGWVPGRYEVEVLLGGSSAGVRGFEVR